MKNWIAATTLALALAPAAALAAPPKSTPELLAKGKTSFATNCVPCHGEKGDGAGPAAAALNPKPRNFGEKFKNGDKPEQVFKTLGEGLQGTAMVAFAHLPEEERWALVYHLGELRKALEKEAKAAAGKKK